MMKSGRHPSFEKLVCQLLLVSHKTRLLDCYLSIYDLKLTVDEKKQQNLSKLEK